MYTNSSTTETLADRHVASRPAITIDSTVTIRDLETGERDVYTLVPPDDADVTRGRISSMTPAGRALYGRRAGEVVEIIAPGGVVRVIIESVRTTIPRKGQRNGYEGRGVANETSGKQ
jgi:transcription elongation GreA/GreB family factor